jgi:hypothetical protein
MKLTGSTKNSKPEHWPLSKRENVKSNAISRSKPRKSNISDKKKKR